jgi:hypothetical protein
MQLHVFDNRHISNAVKDIKKDDTIVLINQLSQDLWSFYFKYNNIDEARLQVKYITQEEFFSMTKVKFDKIVGNPPYTKGNEKLYTRFTQKALELSDSVTFVMPVDLESNHVTLKAHNHRVKTHLKELGENVSHHFNVGYDNIHVVHLDKNIQNEVEEYVNPLDLYIPIFPKRKRLSVFKGSLAIESAEHVKNGLPSIDKVQRGNNLIIKNVDPNLVKIANKNRKVSSPWLVFVNHTPSKGLFNCAYIENKGQPWSMCVIAIEADSEKDAISLQNWLTSETIQKEIKTMFDLKKVYTVSKEMLEMLPWYE